MRVVNRKAFLALPPGTIYCKGVQWAFDGLCIKDESLGNNWTYLDPAWASAHDSGEAFGLLEKSLETGTSFSCEDAYGRDGFFDDDAVFLIFEEPDLKALRDHIDHALKRSIHAMKIGRATSTAWRRGWRQGKSIYQKAALSSEGWAGLMVFLGALLGLYFAGVL